MSSASGIVSFLTCRSCVDTGRRPRIHVGLVDPITIRVWCAMCSRKVVDLTLAEPMPLRCDVCGQPMTPGHMH